MTINDDIFDLLATAFGEDPKALKDEFNRLDKGMVKKQPDNYKKDTPEKRPDPDYESPKSKIYTGKNLEDCLNHLKTEPVKDEKKATVNEYPSNTTSVTEKELLPYTPNSISCTNGNDYTISVKAHGYDINDSVTLHFDHTTHNITYPGITEKQLIDILIDRFKRQHNDYFVTVLSDIARNL